MRGGGVKKEPTASQIGLYQGFLKEIRQKVHRLLYHSLCTHVVEMGGIEPPSESALTGTSPGADGYLHSLIPAQAVMLGDLVASLCMVRSKLCARMFTTDRRSIPGRGPPGWNAR